MSDWATAGFVASSAPVPLQPGPGITRRREIVSRRRSLHEHPVCIGTARGRPDAVSEGMTRRGLGGPRRRCAARDPIEDAGLHRRVRRLGRHQAWPRTPGCLGSRWRLPAC